MGEIGQFRLLTRRMYIVNIFDFLGKILCSVTLRGHSEESQKMRVEKGKDVTPVYPRSGILEETKRTRDVRKGNETR